MFNQYKVITFTKNIEDESIFQRTWEKIVSTVDETID